MRQKRAQSISVGDTQGPSLQIVAKRPSVIGTTQPRQTPNPQAISDSIANEASSPGGVADGTTRSNTMCATVFQTLRTPMPSANGLVGRG